MSETQSPPHPRPHPRFYVPTGTAISPSLPSQSHSRRPSAINSRAIPSSPLLRQPSSAALRSALQGSNRPESRAGSGSQTPRFNRSMSTINLQPSPRDVEVRQEQMDAFIEIHRVLYRGRQDVALEDGRGNLGLAEQGKDVRRVIERWFEGDCGELLHANPSYTYPDRMMIGMRLNHQDSL